MPKFFGSAIDLVFASGAINVLSLAVPLTLMQVYDRILPNNAFNTFGWLIFGCSIAIIVDGVLRYLRSYVSAWSAARYEHRIGVETLERNLVSRLEDFERFGLGVHLDRMNAIAILRSFYAGQVFQVLLDLPFAGLFIMAIYYIAPSLAWIPLVAACVFFCFIVVAKIGYSMSRFNQLTVNDRRFNFVIEVLRGLHLVRAQTMEEQMLRRHDRLQAALAESNAKVGFWSGFPSNLGTMISQITMFSMIGVGGTLVIDGSLTIGGLAACTLLVGRAFQPIQSAASYWLRASEAQIAKKRVEEVFSMAPEVALDNPPFPEDIAGGLHLHDVSFRYGPREPYVVEHLDLKVAPGEMVGIIGSGAAGTTTLLYLMMGALEPESGEVFIDDFKMTEWDHTSLRGRVEYLPASGTLFTGTILENIAMFEPDKNSAALDAAALVGLDELISMLPQGYETPVDNQAATFLPSGLIQRICIARALVVRPRLMLFDKTNASLDQETEKVLLWLLEKMKGHCTIIFVANGEGVLESADRVYELVGGKLVERGQATPAPTPTRRLEAAE